MALMLLCEFILNSTRAPPGEEFLYHTLLELHLMGDDDDDAQAVQLPGTPPTLTASASEQGQEPTPSSSDGTLPSANQVSLQGRCSVWCQHCALSGVALTECQIPVHACTCASTSPSLCDS